MNFSMQIATDPSICFNHSTKLWVSVKVILEDAMVEDVGKFSFAIHQMYR